MCWSFINTVKSFEDTISHIDNIDYNESSFFYGLIDKNGNKTDVYNKICGFGIGSEDFTKLKLEQLLKARVCSNDSFVYPFLFIFELFWNLHISGKDSISLNQLNSVLSVSKYLDFQDTLAECIIPDDSPCPSLDIDLLSKLFTFLSISNNGASLNQAYIDYYTHFFNGPYKSLVTLLNIVGCNDDLYEQVLTKNINIDINLVDSYKKEDSSNKSKNTSMMSDYIQEIYYGSPGSGKSFTVKDKYGVGEKKEFKYRTTFHPDTDYASFVGCYKPVTAHHPIKTQAELMSLISSSTSFHQFVGKYAESLEKLSEADRNAVFALKYSPGTYSEEYSKVLSTIKDRQSDSSDITYKFIPQIFINAYCDAWTKYIENPSEPESVILVIEELNRGNCAQIFGDLFQLLDRDDSGFSEYKIQADTDIANYLLNDSPIKDKMDRYKSLTGSTDDQLKLSLTPNFSIVCTMNTSDQSLFPMDAAFKRRWDWKYVPVNHVDAGKFKVKINDGKIFEWNDDIIEPLNKIIKDITKSDDKQIGNRFVKVRESQKDSDNKYIISKEQFVNKVMFYLWTEIFKDYTENDNSLFMKDEKHFSYDDLFKFDKTGENVQIKDEYVLAFIDNITKYIRKNNL